jgi:hypothetical protein
VLQPAGPPSVRVTFGNENIEFGWTFAPYPIALAGPITLTTAAMAPLAFATKLNSPSGRHSAVGATQKGDAVSPFAYRGSKTQAAPGASEVRRVNRRAAPPPRGVKLMDGVTAAAPTFCTTMVDVVPVRPLSFAF